MSLLVMILLFAGAQTRQRAVRHPAPPAPVFEYRGDGSRSGDYPTTGARVFHSKKWQALVTPSFSAPVYANGVLYVPDGNGRIVAFDGNSGAVKWTSPILGGIVSAPAITSDALYAGVDTHGVAVLSLATGAQIAKLATDNAVFASPAIENGVVYAGTESGTMFAFDAVTRQVKWQFAAGTPLHGHPAVSYGTVFVGAGPSFIAIDPTGHEKWRVAASHGGWSPSFAVATGAVFASDGDTIRAIDAATGAERWSYRRAGVLWTTPAVASGLMIAGDTSRRVTALDAATGTEIWQTTLQDSTEVIAADGVLYGGTANYDRAPDSTLGQKFYAIDTLTGQILWSYDVMGEIRSGAAVGDGKVFFYSLSRAVYALQ